MTQLQYLEMSNCIILKLLIVKPQTTTDTMIFFKNIIVKHLVTTLQFHNYLTHDSQSIATTNMGNEKVSMNEVIRYFNVELINIYLVFNS